MLRQANYIVTNIEGPTNNLHTPSLPLHYLRMTVSSQAHRVTIIIQTYSRLMLRNVRTNTCESRMASAGLGTSPGFGPAWAHGPRLKMTLEPIFPDPQNLSPQKMMPISISPHVKSQGIYHHMDAHSSASSPNHCWTLTRRNLIVTLLPLGDE